MFKISGIRPKCGWQKRNKNFIRLLRTNSVITWHVRLLSFACTKTLSVFIWYLTKALQLFHHESGRVFCKSMSFCAVRTHCFSIWKSTRRLQHHQIFKTFSTTTMKLISWSSISFNLCFKLQSMILDNF